MAAPYICLSLYVPVSEAGGWLQVGFCGGDYTGNETTVKNRIYRPVPSPFTRNQHR